MLAQLLRLGSCAGDIKGSEEVWAALDEDLGLLVDLIPRVVVALSIAALIWVMMPREKMSALVGSESGIRGLIIATIAGTVTPGGPSSGICTIGCDRSDGGRIAGPLWPISLLGRPWACSEF